MKPSSMLLLTLLSIGSEKGARAQSLTAVSLPENPFTEAAEPNSPAFATAEGNSASSTASSSAALTSGQQVSARESKFDRWMDVNELSFSARYRSETGSNDIRYFANGQERSIIDGRLKLDSTARYTLNYRISSGRSFNWSYSDIINPDFNEVDEKPAVFASIPLPILIKLGQALAAGYSIPNVPSRGWEMSPRQLYVSATPVSWLTAEYGSLGIERGKNSEITSYDDDGYLTGERLRLRNPKHLFFDEISVTYAFEGDIFKPNFIDRTQHLKKSNYHQFLFTKNFSKRVGASTDYTFDKKTHTVREAAYIKLPETKVLDAVRMEFYQRLNTVVVGPFPFSGGSGFGVTAEKTFFAKRVKLDGGYEQVDPNYGATVDNVLGAVFGFSMNGDSYSTGKHVFAHANVKIAPFASLSGFYIHQTQQPGPGDFGFAKEGFNAGLNIDLKKLVNSRQRVF